MEVFKPEPLTKVEQKYLEIIESLVTQFNRFPTLREIAEAKGTPNIITPARAALQRLERKGYLKSLGLLFSVDGTDVYLADILVLIFIILGVLLTLFFLFLSNWAAALGTATLTYALYRLYKAMP
jgi:LexA DNA binding domain